MTNYPVKAGSYIVITPNRLYLVMLTGTLPMLQLSSAIDYNEFLKGRVVKLTTDERKSIALIDSEKCMWLPVLHGLNIQTKERIAMISRMSQVDDKCLLDEMYNDYYDLKKIGIADIMFVSKLVAEYNVSLELATSLTNIFNKNYYELRIVPRL